MELSKYVTLVSSDGYEFVVLREAACVSGAIRRMLDPKSGFGESISGRCVFEEIKYVLFLLFCLFELDLLECKEMGMPGMITIDFWSTEPPSIPPEVGYGPGCRHPHTLDLRRLRHFLKLCATMCVRVLANSILQWYRPRKGRRVFLL